MLHKPAKEVASLSRTLAVATLLLCGSAGAALAQANYSPSPLAPKTAPTGVILAVADALGMVRGAGSNIFDGINRIQYDVEGTAYEPRRSGEWPRYQIKSGRIGISYHIAAERTDIVSVDASGAQRRTVKVVSGPDAWDETTPGVGGKPAPQGAAAERARDIWITPQGFMSQVMKADPKAVKVSQAGAKTLISLDLNGEPATATIGADKRPEKIEVRVKNSPIGPTTLEVDYSDYKDFDHYAIQAPSHIVEKLGGRPLLDLTVTAFHTGPYLAFPPPADLGRAAQN